MSTDTATTRPFDAASARSIARAFLPTWPLGNRYDYYYTWSKLCTDPLYPGVLQALRGSRAPVLDLGCGLGLLAHSLRHDGQSLGYHGVDIDAAKIRRATRIAARNGLDGARFDVLDLAEGSPSHQGSVAILDVLQYLDEATQSELLDASIAMLTPGARLVMRAALDDGSERHRRTRITDRLANLIGWMQARPKHYPNAEGLQSRLRNAGLTVTMSPLYGNTPFNHWLIVAHRDDNA